MTASEQHIEAWVEARRLEWSNTCGVLAIVQLAGAVLLFVMFSLFFGGALALIAEWIFGVKSLLWYGVGVLAVIVLCWLFDRVYSEDSTFLSAGSPWAVNALGGALGTLVFSVPLLVREARKNIAKISRLQSFDVARCAAALHRLVVEETAVELSVLEEEYGAEVLGDLLEIEGVLHLKREPQGLALADDLRERLLAASSGS